MVWSALDLGGAKRRVVDADVVDQAGEELAIEAVAADLQRVGGGRDRSGVGGRRDLGAVDIQAHRRPVIGLGKERPDIGRQLGCTERVGVRAARDQPRVRPRRVARGCRQVEVVVALVDHVAPLGVDRRRVHPRLQRHPTRQMQRRGVGDRHQRAGAVELQRPAVLARRRPRRIGDRAVVPVPRRIGHGRPRPLIKPIRRHQPRRRRAHVFPRRRSECDLKRGTRAVVGKELPDSGRAFAGEVPGEVVMDGLARSGAGLDAVRASAVKRAVSPDLEQGRWHGRRLALSTALDNKRVETAGDSAVAVAGHREGSASREPHRSAITADTKHQPVQRPPVQVPDV